jgi:hypothetical protein
MFFLCFSKNSDFCYNDDNMIKIIELGLQIMRNFKNDFFTTNSLRKFNKCHRTSDSKSWVDIIDAINDILLFDDILVNVLSDVFLLLSTLIALFFKMIDK